MKYATTTTLIVELADRAAFLDQMTTLKDYNNNEIQTATTKARVIDFIVSELEEAFQFGYEAGVKDNE